MSLDHHYWRQRLIDQQRRLDAIRQSDLRADFNRLHKAVANSAPKRRDYRAISRSMDRRLAAIGVQQTSCEQTSVTNAIGDFKRERLDARFDPWSAARSGLSFSYFRKV